MFLPGIRGFNEAEWGQTLPHQLSEFKVDLPNFLLWLNKFVNGVVSIVLSFIDMQELMFVNVYMSYKYTIDILP